MGVAGCCLSLRVIAWPVAYLCCVLWCFMNVCCLFVFCGSPLVVDCCVLCVVVVCCVRCWLLCVVSRVFDVGPLLFDVRCLLLVVYCSLFVVVVCCLLFVV